MIRLLRLPSLALAAVLLLAQGSARVLLECATKAGAVTAMTKHDAAPLARHEAHRMHPGASHAGHAHGQSGEADGSTHHASAAASPGAPGDCRPSDTSCGSGDDDARCELMLGCAAPGAPGVVTALASAGVAAVAIAGPAIVAAWTHREPATPPPRG